MWELRVLNLVIQTMILGPETQPGSGFCADRKQRQMSSNSRDRKLVLFQVTMQRWAATGQRDRTVDKHPQGLHKTVWKKKVSLKKKKSSCPNYEQWYITSGRWARSWRETPPSLPSMAKCRKGQGEQEHWKKPHQHSRPLPKARQQQHGGVWSLQ